MVFSKSKMIARLENNGMSDAITPGIIDIMDNLDGQVASTASWNRQVNGAPVFSCKGKDGKFYEVNETDCIY